MSDSTLTLIKGGKTDPEVGHTMEDVTEDVAPEEVESQDLELVLIRIVSGEDLLCSVIGGTDATITIINPLVVVLHQEEGNLGVKMGPYFMPFARGPITLNTGNVVALLREFDPQLTENYKQFFSPIIRPNPSGIVLN